MNDMDKLAKGIADVVEDVLKRKTSAYDTSAEVKRVSNGTAWVHIPGGVDETPVKLTSNAKPGDSVQVRVSGGRAWITGNATNPPTDDTRANEAHRYAGSAIVIGKEAYAKAENADKDAARANIAANKAEQSANEANTQAQRATTYANNALDQLGIVQDVVGVLDWASTHGNFIPTEDEHIVEHKVYFVLDSTTHDYMPVVNPQESELSNYYELSMQEAMQTYILSHLAVTSRGLWILPSGLGNAQDEQYAPGYKMLLAAGQNPGMYLYDQNGYIVTTYGANGVEFSSGKAFHIGNQTAFIAFNPANGGSITIGGASITLGGDKTLDQVLASMNSTINNTLIYDHTYTYNYVDNEAVSATFTAYLYRGGVDVKNELDDEDNPLYPPSAFTWYLKKEDENGVKEVPIIDPVTQTNEGYQCTVLLANCGFGAEVIGKFTSLDDSQVLDTNGNNLTNIDNDPLSVRATGDTVRVRDLTTSSVIFPNEKLMVVGSEDEHLVTIQTLAQYILESETHILYCGTATELV